MSLISPASSPIVNLVTLPLKIVFLGVTIVTSIVKAPICMSTAVYEHCVSKQEEDTNKNTEESEFELKDVHLSHNSQV